MNKKCENCDNKCVIAESDNIPCFCLECKNICNLAWVGMDDYNNPCSSCIFNDNLENNFKPFTSGGGHG